MGIYKSNDTPDRRAMISYEFFIEMCFPLQLIQKKMFGVSTFYYDEKVVFALRKKDDNPIDNGIWIASKVEFHLELKEQIKDLRPIAVYGIKTWLLLPEDSDYFEEGALRVSELIKQHSKLIGNIPKPKKKKSK